MNQVDNKVSRRLSVLELSQALGNISDSCRQNGISSSQFNEYKQRFQTAGLEGLKDLPSSHRSHPRVTPIPIVNAILALSIEHPSWGCIRLSDALKTKSIQISSPTIQNILIKSGMGNKYERFQKLEEKAFTTMTELTAEQISAIEKVNPCFRERFSRSGSPGELLAQDTIYIGDLDVMGKVYLQAVIDTYCNYTFGFLHTGKQPDCAVSILHNTVFPFYREHNLIVKAILTDNGKEYCGSEKHHFELYLLLNDIEHRKTVIHSPSTNGFVKRFGQICTDEFFTPSSKNHSYQSLEALQADFDRWLLFYNTQRPNNGFPNMGQCPQEIMSKG
jgi:Homeodomain-like domain/Integrase core domain